MGNKRGAQLTDHFAVACTPEMKKATTAAGERHGVDKSTIVRWAVQDWLNANMSEASETADEGVPV